MFSKITAKAKGAAKSASESTKRSASKLAASKAGKKVLSVSESVFALTPAGKRYQDRKSSRLRAEEDAFLVELMEAEFDPHTVSAVTTAFATAKASHPSLAVAEAELGPEREPSWVGTALAEGEYEVGVAAADQDRAFAESLAEVLAESGFSVTTQTAQLHRTRVFVLVYSEFTVAESMARIITDAASRFNSGSTIILPVVHPRTAPAALDRIPDSLAYSLSNTTMFGGFQFDLDPLVEVYDELVSTINNYLHPETASWWLTGVWRFELVVTGESGSPAYETKDMLVYLEQIDAEHVRGLTADKVSFHGRLDGSVLRLTGKYVGPYAVHSEGWSSDDFAYVADLAVAVRNQGHSLEGTFADYADVSGLRHGTARAVRGGSGITGFYKLEMGELDDIVLGINHEGASKLEFALPGSFGRLLDGVFHVETNEFTVAAELGPYNSLTLVGELKRRAADRLHIKRHHIKGVMYAIESGLNKAPRGCHAFKGKYLTESKVGLIPSPPLVGQGDDAADDAAETMLRDTLVAPHLGPPRASAAFVPYAFAPLEPDEFATVVVGPAELDDVSDALAASLDAEGIAPVSTDWARHGARARTIILLLSKDTASDLQLIDFVCDAAASDTPIFNVGVAPWTDIFYHDGWDPTVRSRFKAALARLNMTDASTLDPTHPSFFAMVASIRRHVTPREHLLAGAWMLRPSLQPDPTRNGDSAAAASNTAQGQQGQGDASDVDDLTYFVFIYHEPGATALTAVDLRGHRWVGTLADATLTLTSDGMEMVMSVSSCGTMMAGIIRTSSHDTVSGAANWTNESVTMRDRLMASTQWMKKKMSKVKDFAYVGTLESDGLSGLFFEKPEPSLAASQETMVARTKAYHADWLNLPRTSSGAEVEMAVDGGVSEPRFYGVFQRGGSRLLIKYGDGRWHAGTVRDGVAKFVIRDALRSGVHKTIIGRIVKVSTGLYLYGYSYLSSRLAFKLPYRAKKHLSEQEVAVVGSDETCPHPQVTDVVRAYWTSFFAADYATFVSLWIDGYSDILTPAVFDGLVDATRAARPPYGDFVGVRYIGSLPVENDAHEAWRFEYECEFSLRGKTRWCFLLNDAFQIVRALDRQDLARRTRCSEDVMISYRSTDSGFIDLLQAYLEDHNVTVWRDRRMETGENWSKAITTAVRRSGCVISALSSTYLTSSLCTKEVRMASDVGQTIIPLVLPQLDCVPHPYESTAPPATLARALANVSLIDFRRSDGEHAADTRPDPTTATELRRRYPEQLSALLRQIQHIRSSKIAWDISGPWRLGLEMVGPDSQTMAPTVVFEQMGNTLRGSANVFGGMVQMVIDDTASAVIDSHVHFTLLADERKFQLTIRAMLSTDGESFDGLFWSPTGNRGRVHGSRVERRQSVTLGGRSSNNLDDIVARVRARKSSTSSP